MCPQPRSHDPQSWFLWNHLCSRQSCTLTGLRTLIPGRSTVWSLHVLPFGFSPGFPPSPDMQRGIKANISLTYGKILSQYPRIHG
uniref:Uncharacterized protein n=1 Tax=Pipistrellus kuhlii TaxID=59472 RepID=A0A7J7UTP1_PIPKU|nr:hypothetical protein mPipKuh1_008740 [Pipistrellus kuhlii]